MNRRTLHIVCTVLVACSLLACALPVPGKRTTAPTLTTEPTAGALAVTRAATATSGPTPTPTPSPTPLPPTLPLLLYRQPERGQELQVDSPLVLTFDQAMDRASVQQAFAIEPAVAGQFTWPDDRIAIFEPVQPWKREAVYRVAIDTSAKSREGLPLQRSQTCTQARRRVVCGHDDRYHLLT